MEGKNYVPPQVELFDVAAERGFEASALTGEVESFDREEWNE